MALSVTIGGTDRVAYLANRTLRVTATDGNRAPRCDFTLVDFVPLMGVAFTVVVADGATTYFDGTITGLSLSEFTTGHTTCRVTAFAAGTIPGQSEAPFGLSDVSPTATYARWAALWAPYCWWRLGEASGTTATDEKGVQDGTYVNAPTLGVTGPMANITDTAATFNGTDEYVTVGAANLRGRVDLSIAAWAKSSSAAALQMIYVERNTLNDALIRFYLDTNGRPTFQWRNDAGVLNTIVPTTGDYTDGAWHHFAVTKDSLDVIIYVDGIGVKIETMTGSSTQTSTMTANIARDPHLDDLFFAGSLDEVMIWRSALPRGVIKGLYSMRDVRRYLRFTLDVLYDGAVFTQNGTVTTLDAGLVPGQELTVTSANFDTVSSSFMESGPAINELVTEWVDETPRYTATFGDVKPRLAAAFP